MRKLILFNMLSAEGFFTGAREDLSWHKVDKEVNEFMADQLQTADTLLFGKKTYQLMEDFWPTEEAFRQDPVIAQMMGDYLKIVFSSSLEKTSWNPTRLVQANAIEEVQKLKNTPGKDLIIFGSAALSNLLLQHQLIDELRLMINPVVLGQGKPFFTNLRLNLQLIKARVFGNGNVLLSYILK